MYNEDNPLISEDDVAARIPVDVIAATEVGQKFGELIKKVYRHQSRVVVEKGGIPVAALVSLSDLERWTRQDEERERRFSVIDEVRQRNVDQTPEEVERDVDQEI